MELFIYLYDQVNVFVNMMMVLVYVVSHVLI